MSETCPHCRSDDTERISGWDDSIKPFGYCNNCSNLWDTREPKGTESDKEEPHSPENEMNLADYNHETAARRKS